MAEQEGHQSLQGKTVLVTGASRGIGAAAAKRLARAGAAVVINYHQNRQAAQKVLQGVEKAGGRGMIFQADVTKPDQVDAMVRSTREKFSSVDVLVNNAYFPFEVGQLHELPWDKFHQAIEHELLAFHNCVRACLPGMIKKKSGRGMIFQADVTKPDQVDAMVRSTREKFSSVDVLVNNAYFPFEVGQLHELPWDKFHQAIEHELLAFHNCVRACLPGMIKKKSG